MFDDNEYTYFKNEILKLVNIDLNSYKAPQMMRRLASLITRIGLSGYREYVDFLKRDTTKVQEFKDFITINVTEFFRNPEKWDELRRIIIPTLERTKKNSALKLWSAGCSYGAEPYTLAITMEEFFPNHPYSILATDIDQEVLGKAQRGIYREVDYKAMDTNLSKKYFTPTNDGSYVIRESLKRNINFKKNNLLMDNFENNYDLILCRNVVIYFTEEAKQQLYKKFFNALRSEGILFIGSTESILNARDIGFGSQLNFFYQR